MVERYWFGIHKIPGTTESTSTSAPNEPLATAKETLVYDFSNLDGGHTADQLGDRLHVLVHGPSDQTPQHSDTDALPSWTGLDPRAEPATVPPAAKQDGSPA